jgi:predicted nucleic acid-binding protein
VDTLHQVARDAVPDMPDPIVAATAVYFGVPVISRADGLRFRRFDRMSVK